MGHQAHRRGSVVKYVRIQIVLLMSSLLRDHGSFTEEDIRQAMPVSKSSFNRAISDYRSYLMEFEQGYELVFDNRNKSYKLLKLSF